MADSIQFERKKKSSLLISRNANAAASFDPVPGSHY